MRPGGAGSVFVGLCVCGRSRWSCFIVLRFAWLLRSSTIAGPLCVLGGRLAVRLAHHVLEWGLVAVPVVRCVLCFAFVSLFVFVGVLCCWPLCASGGPTISPAYALGGPGSCLLSDFLFVVVVVDAVVVVALVVVVVMVVVVAVAVVVVAVAVVVVMVVVVVAGAAVAADVLVLVLVIVAGGGDVVVAAVLLLLLLLQ